MEPTTPETPEVTVPVARTPYDLLAIFPTAPKAGDIAAFQAQVPGGRLRLLPMPDGKRLFLLRAFSGPEMAEFQAEVAKVPEDKQLGRLHAIVASRCTLWTSATANGKMSETDIQSAGAGLASTLYNAITDLSDFIEPAFLEQLYVDF